MTNKQLENLTQLFNDGDFDGLAAYVEDLMADAYSEGESYGRDEGYEEGLEAVRNE